MWQKFWPIVYNTMRSTSVNKTASEDYSVPYPVAIKGLPARLKDYGWKLFYSRHTKSLKRAQGFTKESFVLLGKRPQMGTFVIGSKTIAGCLQSK